MWAAAWMKRLEVMRKMDGIRIDSESCGVGVGAILDKKDGVNPMKGMTQMQFVGRF